MYDIPQPELLDPNRHGADRDTMAAADHRDRAERLAAELRQTCAYGQALWAQLQAVRRYLIDSLPRPATGGAALDGARPTGQDDLVGWQAWMDAYAGVVSVLEGPHGDSGFARDEASQLVRARRDFAADQQPTLETIERA
ncbi:MAG TPA: hypothetical protein VE442_18205 [Jatrophihabitans sp.]|jgi:hypothetical protein|nr:hypothetical protein [Jatrophihabitans sp.]